MERFKCLIVEDEPLAVEVLKEYIAKVPFLSITKCVSDAIYAMEVLQHEKIDVIFLDIHLPVIKGLDFIRTLNQPLQVILTTAHREYAIEGYELNVTDYLLKPISFTRFLAAVNKLKPIKDKDDNYHPLTNKNNDTPHLFININKKKIKINLNEILYIESKKEYINIVTTTKNHLTKYQIGDIEHQLDKKQFIRVHRSFIISKEKVTAFTSTDIEINRIQIPIGRNYKEGVLAIFGEEL